MNWDDFRTAFSQARNTFNQADSVAADMGSMLVGRLHNCSRTTLESLKRELRDYNIHTGSWKDHP